MVKVDPAKKAVPATDSRPWRVASCGDGFGFVFQLGGGAVGVRDIVPFAEINGIGSGERGSSASFLPWVGIRCEVRGL